jgi:hypothetical protein
MCEQIPLFGEDARREYRMARPAGR